MKQEMPPEQRLIVAISSRALFDLGESHTLFEREGLDAYRAYQMARENDLLAPGIAFPLVEKLLRINRLSTATPRIEVILLSRNSSDTGLRVDLAVCAAIWRAIVLVRKP